MRIIVTGGAGHLGVPTATRLHDDGHDVFVLDNLSVAGTSTLSALPTPVVDRLVRADLRDPDVVRAMCDLRPDVIVHLGARLGVPEAVADPAGDACTNIVGTIHTVQAAVGAGAALVCASSGGTVYGTCDQELIDESAPLNPVSAHGLSKATAERYVELLAGGRVRWCALAFANIYGPRVHHNGAAGIVSVWARRMLNGDRCHINGDGRVARDFIYVDDAVDALVRAAASQSSGRFNIGSGVAVTMRDLHTALARAAGVADDPEFAASLTEEVPRYALDASAAGAAFGWRPTIGLDEGLRRTVDALRDPA